MFEELNNISANENKFRSKIGKSRRKGLFSNNFYIQKGKIVKGYSGAGARLSPSTSAWKSDTLPLKLHCLSHLDINQLMPKTKSLQYKVPGLNFYGKYSSIYDTQS